MCQLPNCEKCGQFCIPKDSGIYYGDSTMFEPPDPAFWCKKCYAKLIEQAIKFPTTVITRCWWIKPTYVAIAKSIICHQRNICTKTA